MSQLDLEAVNPIGPLLGQIRAIAVTTSSARFDLSALAEFGTGGDEMARVFRFTANGGDVYIAFNTSNAGSIDETNTTAGNATQCDVIPDGQFRDFRMPYVNGTGLATWLLVKGSVACKLRISKSSEDPIQRIR
jgi:hypothetical protein